MPIQTAVFPVAGLGTRFLPATKSTPKEMLPVVDKPLIQYAAEEAVSAGVEGLVFITSRMKHSIADHFDTAFELEHRLEQSGKHDLLRRCRQTLPREVNRIYIPQAEALGLGHAVGCARPAIGDGFFAVLLADDLILPEEQNCLAEMIEVHERTGASVIGVQEVPDAEIHRYGVVTIEAREGRTARISGIVEKPALADAPSRLGVVGRYILSPRILDCIDAIGPDDKGEIQLTDAIARLMEDEPVYAHRFRGRRYDCGNREGFVHATLDAALDDAEMGPRLRSVIRSWLPENDVDTTP